MKLLQKWPDRTIIVVENSLEALQKIAAYKRNLYGKDLKVIAITGSVGKTSTKDMVANVVAQKYKTMFLPADGLAQAWASKYGSEAVSFDGVHLTE